MLPESGRGADLLCSSFPVAIKTTRWLLVVITGRKIGHIGITGARSPREPQHTRASVRSARADVASQLNKPRGRGVGGPPED